MMLVHVAFLYLLQDALEVGVHDKWDSSFPAVVIETQPLVVFARQPRAVVHLTAVCRVDLQRSVGICRKIIY